MSVSSVNDGSVATSATSIPKKDPSLHSVDRNDKNFLPAIGNACNQSNNSKQKSTGSDIKFPVQKTNSQSNSVVSNNSNSRKVKNLNSSAHEQLSWKPKILTDKDVKYCRKLDKLLLSKGLFIKYREENTFSLCTLDGLDGLVYVCCDIHVSIVRWNWKGEYFDFKNAAADHDPSKTAAIMKSYIDNRKELDYDYNEFNSAEGTDS